MRRAISRLLSRSRWLVGLVVAVVVLLGGVFIGGGLVTRATNDFPDVPTGAFYHDSVSFIKAKGITAGCGGGNYCPNNGVTRGEMAVFLERLAGQGAAPSVDAALLDGIDSTDILPGGTAPSGTTIRGTYWMGDVASASFDLATSEISFGYQFSAAPTDHFIQFGSAVPAGCSGTASSPGADAGHLCVFESNVVNAGGRDVNGPGGDGTTYPFGARLFVRSAAGGTFWSAGTWAATAGP